MCCAKPMSLSSRVHGIRCTRDPTQWVMVALCAAGPLQHLAYITTWHHPQSCSLKLWHIISCCFFDASACSCGTFDVGDTNSFGDTKQPRFGCNGSLRWELAKCEGPAPQCVNELEAAIDIATGALLPQTPFTSLQAK